MILGFCEAGAINITGKILKILESIKTKNQH